MPQDISRLRKFCVDLKLCVNKNLFVLDYFKSFEGNLPFSECGNNIVLW